MDPPKPKFMDAMPRAQSQIEIVQEEEMLVYLKAGTADSVPGVRFVVSKDCTEAIANALRGRRVAVDVRLKCPHLTQWDSQLKAIVGPVKHLAVFVVGRQMEALRPFTAWREDESGLFCVPPEAVCYYTHRGSHIINGKSNVKKIWAAYDPFMEAARQVCNRFVLFDKISHAFRRILSIVLSTIAVVGVSA